MSFSPHELVHEHISGTGQQGGNASSLGTLFSSLAVPAGLFYAQQNFPLPTTGERPKASDSNVVPKSLFDNLMELAEIKPKKKQTKKRTKKEKPNKGNKKTRRV
tara:strand:+ start:87 stop:398 length:312 start_codon:yes stop_codon:yes gene_type:complete